MFSCQPVSTLEALTSIMLDFSSPSLLRKAVRALRRYLIGEAYKNTYTKIYTISH